MPKYVNICIDAEVVCIGEVSLSVKSSTQNFNNTTLTQSAVYSQNGWSQGYIVGDRLSKVDNVFSSRLHRVVCCRAVQAFLSRLISCRWLGQTQLGV